MNSEIKTGLVIMASGKAVRFGRNKLMEPLLEKPLISWILDTTENLFDARIVVTRSEDVRDLCKERNIPCIFHELPNRNDTVHLGLSALKDQIDFCFFMPGDQPLIKRETLEKLQLAAKENKNGIVRASFLGTVGAPVGFSKKYFEELLNLPEGKGGNVVVKKHPEHLILIPVSEAYELQDIDTVDDFEKIKKIVEKRK